MNETLRGSLLLGALGLLAATGCNRDHLSDNYGRQTRAFFAKQHVHGAAAQGSPSGLDSEESALIKASYRRSLGEQSAEQGAASSRVLLVEDDDVRPKR